MAKYNIKYPRLTNHLRLESFFLYYIYEFKFNTIIYSDLTYCI